MVGCESFAERVRLLGVGVDRIAIGIKPIGMIGGRVCVDQVGDIDKPATTVAFPGVGILQVGGRTDPREAGLLGPGHDAARLATGAAHPGS